MTPSHQSGRVSRSTMGVYIVTGFPGSGKTTLVERVLDELSPCDAGGFVTREVRENSKRIGFDIHTLDGEHAALARVGPGSPRVGKYAVDIDSFDRVGVRSLEKGLAEGSSLLVADEVGKMELFSRKFRQVVRRIVEDDLRLFATVPMRSSDTLVQYLKQHPRSKTWQVDRGSFSETLGEVAEAIGGDIRGADSGI